MWSGQSTEQWPPLSRTTERSGGGGLFFFSTVKPASLLLARLCRSGRLNKVKATLFDCLFVFASGKLLPLRHGNSTFNG